MNHLRIPRQRRAALWPWAEGFCAWFRIAGLRVHEQQLLEAIAQLELLGDLDGNVHTLPRLTSKLLQVQLDLALETDARLPDRPTNGMHHAANAPYYVEPPFSTITTITTITPPQQPEPAA